MNEKEIITCTKCGNDCNIGNYVKSVKEELRNRQFCFECNFWYELYLRKDDKDVIRLNGVHYALGEDKPNTTKGSYGRKYVVEFMDGRVVTTTDLWHQGNIPDIWKKDMPDNTISLKNINN